MSFQGKIKASQLNKTTEAARSKKSFKFDWKRAIENAVMFIGNRVNTTDSINM